MVRHPLKDAAKQLVRDLNKAADRGDQNTVYCFSGKLKSLGLPWARIEPELNDAAKQILSDRPTTVGRGSK